MNDAKKITIRDVQRFIADASKEERRLVAEALSARLKDDVVNARFDFKVGDRVKFTAKRRGWPQVVRGVLAQKNLKTFVVRPSSGGRDWKVAASLIEKDDQAPTERG